MKKRTSTTVNPKPPYKALAIFIIVVLGIIALDGYANRTIFYKNKTKSPQETTLENVYSARTKRLLAGETESQKEAVLGIIQEILINGDLSFEDRAKFIIKNCELETVYNGVKDSEKFHASMGTKFVQSSEDCIAYGASEYFVESFWVDGKTYNRQAEDGDFSVLPANPTVATAHHPQNYLVNLFGDLKGVEVISINENSDEVLVKASMEKATYIGEFEFALDKQTYKAKNINYVLETPDNSKSEGKFGLNYDEVTVNAPKAD